MKKFFTFAVVCILGVLSMQAQLQYVRSSFRPASGAAKNVTDWHSDKNAILVVIGDNMSSSEINGITIKSLSNGAKVSYSETKNFEGSPAKWFYIPEDTSSFDIELSLAGQGTTTISGVTMRKHNVYTAKVNSQGVKEGVDVIINSNPAGAEVYIDTHRVGTTPLVAENVVLGVHNIVLKPENTQTCEELSQTVKIDAHTRPLNFDLYRKGNVEFTTYPAAAMVTILKDGKEIKKGTGMFTVENIPFGTYTVKGQYGMDSTETSITIDNNTKQPIEVRVVPSRSITFTATQNNLPVNGADITIDGKYVGVTPLTYQLTYGVHSVVIAKGAYSTKPRSFTVSRDSKESYISLKLPNQQQKRHNIFDNYYNKREWGISANYITRSYKVKSNYDGTYTQNFWGEGRSDNGFQIGISYQGYYGYGQGFVTGLYYQGFFGSCGGPYMDSYDGDYTESALYIPLQYQFRLPFATNFSIFINAGVGMSIGLANQFKFGGDSESTNAGYGYSDEFNRQFPGAFDCSLLFGGGIQYKALQVEAKYGMGLMNYKNLGSSYDSNAKSRTLSIGLSLMF